MRLSLIRHENKYNDKILIKTPYILKVLNGNEQIYMIKVPE